MRLPLRCLVSALAILCFHGLSRAETFRIATYNVENYLDSPAQARSAKSVEAKSKVCESIRALQPDIIALEEIGGQTALQELRGSLKTAGLDFPNWELVTGADTNIHIVILSRFPFAARYPHTNDTFLLSGRRYRVSRGFAEVEIQVNTNFAFTLIAAHLKSRRAVPQADEAELRLEEAKLLRQTIEARLAANPQANLVVLGDLNDTRDSPSTKLIIGRGKHKLLDTRPAERNGDPEWSAAGDSRRVTWTHYYGKEDTYSRIDYILLSSQMVRNWISRETYILTLPDWGLASDHRPLVATFDTEPAHPSAGQTDAAGPSDRLDR